MKNVGKDTGNAGVEIRARSGRAFGGIPSKGIADPQLDAVNQPTGGA